MGKEQFVNTEALMQRWKINTVPVYRFSDPEMSGTRLISPVATQPESWIRLLPQNLPQLIDEVLIGDNEATNIFYTYWQQKLVRFFLPKARADADDLAQEALLKINHALPVFENSGEGTFSRNLNNYCYAVARYSFYDYLRSRRKQPKAYELTGREKARTGAVVDDKNQEEGNSPTWDMFWEKVEPILPERQWQIVDQMRRNYGNVVIMRNLGLGSTVFRHEAHAARQAITDQLLTPAGLKAINSPEFNAVNTDILKEASRRGRIDAIKILDRWYTTDRAYQTFVWQRSHPITDTTSTFRSHTSETRKAEIRYLAELGLTTDEIATELNRHPNVVKRALAEMRRDGETVKTRRPSSANKKDYNEFDKQVKQLRDSSMKNDDIALFLGVSLGSVTRSIDRSSKSGELVLRQPFGR